MNFSKSKNMKGKSDLLNTSEDDFASPIVFRKFKSAPTISNTKSKCEKKKTTRKKQVSLHQIIKENLQHSDVNAEHLQMAIALSKSTSEGFNTKDEEAESTWNLDHSKGKSDIKRTLLEFGFKSERSKMNVENRVDRNKTVPIKSKKSKFRFITPTLINRTEEDRELLKQVKISQILSKNAEKIEETQIIQEYEVMSKSLNEIKCSDCAIFRLNQKLSNTSPSNFKVPELNIPEYGNKCGSLLKNWRNIAMRDFTPERQRILIKSARKENYVQSETNSSKSVREENSSVEMENDLLNVDECSIEKQTQLRGNINMSPDLFDDTFEQPNELLKMNPVRKSLDYVFSQTQSNFEGEMNKAGSNDNESNENCLDKNFLECSVRSNSGICHFDLYNTGENLYLNYSSDNDRKTEEKHVPIDDDSTTNEKCLMETIETVSKDLEETLVGQENFAGNISENEGIYSVAIELYDNEYRNNISKEKKVKSTKIPISLRKKQKEFETKKMNSLTSTLENVDVDEDIISLSSSDEESEVKKKDQKYVQKQESDDSEKYSGNDFLELKTQTVQQKSEISMINNDTLSSSIENCKMKRKKSMENISITSIQNKKDNILSDSADLKDVRRKLREFKGDSSKNSEESICLSSDEEMEQLSEREISKTDLEINYDNYPYSMCSANAIDNESQKKDFAEVSPKYAQKIYSKRNSLYILSSSDDENDKILYSTTPKSHSKTDEMNTQSDTKFKRNSRKYSSRFSNTIEFEMNINQDFSLRETVEPKLTDSISLDSDDEVPSSNLISKKLNEKKQEFDCSLRNFGLNAQKSANVSNDPMTNEKSLDRNEKEKSLENSKLDMISLDTKNASSVLSKIENFENNSLSHRDQLNTLRHSSDNISSICNVSPEMNHNLTDDLSLNWSEHIEKMLSENYSPINSLLLAGGRGSFGNQNQINNEMKEIELERSHSENEIICISDDELNYSCASKKHKNRSDEDSNTVFRKCASFNVRSKEKSETGLTRNKSESFITPKRNCTIKTKDITPMMEYDALSTPDIVKELDKFGLKPLKRKRGVNLLKYIYEATHPLVEKDQIIQSDETERETKRIKKTENENVLNCGKSTPSDQKLLWDPWIETIPDSEIIFEKKRSSKTPTCQIPLQIVWHNFLAANPALRENVLLYEPIQVEVIHKMLKEEGFSFHVQDLITFFDRKCITIRVAQN